MIKKKDSWFKCLNIRIQEILSTAIFLKLCQEKILQLSNETGQTQTLQHFNCFDHICREKMLAQRKGMPANIVQKKRQLCNTPP